jgi:hypothetical protein
LNDLGKMPKKNAVEKVEERAEERRKKKLMISYLHELKLKCQTCKRNVPHENFIKKKNMYVLALKEMF